MKKTKTVTSYRHPAPVSDETPDTAPGNYYVSVRDGERVNALLGPFVNNHARALAFVEPVRAKANEVNFKAAFYSFGTLRMEESFNRPAMFNEFFPEAFAA